MLRSPFFLLFVLSIFLSCQEQTTIPIKADLSRKNADLLQEKAVNLFKKNNYNSAFYYFNKSKILFESIKDSSNIVFNSIQMANIEQINGDYYGSKETLTEALPYSKVQYNYSAAINNLFGIADKELSLYDDAIYYYSQALKDLKDPISKQSPLNNIGVVYIKQKKYDKAIEILESILQKKVFDQKTSSLKTKSRVIDNLGFAYFKNGQTEKGLRLVMESLKLRKQLNDSYGSIESYTHLSEFYLKTDSRKSKEYATNAYEIATMFNSVDERLKALSLLIANDSATKYAQKYILINDSIIKVRNNFKNKFAKIKYDSKKEKDENVKLRLKQAESLVAIKESEKVKVVLYAVIATMLVALFFFVYYQNKRHKHKTRLVEMTTAYNTETRIAKDIHDELANDVFNAITYTQTQTLTANNSKEPLLLQLNDIYSRVRGISRENSNIDTGINYSVNLKEMLSTYNTPDTNVIITNIEKINWKDLENEKKVIIYRVLQELMVNMKKHSQASVVSIKFDSNANFLLIDYSDLGKGCEKSKIIKNGLQNMENRILAIKGTIIFDTEPDKGFKVKITMPK